MLTQPEIIELPIAWILAIISTLGLTIATMATVIWNFVRSRLAAQDKLIASQTTVIERLQDDVARMSKGCGIEICHWRPSR